MKIEMVCSKKRVNPVGWVIKNKLAKKNSFLFSQIIPPSLFIEVGCNLALNN